LFVSGVEEAAQFFGVKQVGVYFVEIRRREPPPADGLVEGSPDERVVMMPGRRRQSPPGEPGVVLVQVEGRELRQVLAPERLGHLPDDPA